MTIKISPQTQTLIDEQMKKGGFSDADEVLRRALEVLRQAQTDYEDLDPETQAAIEEAEAQYERGEGVPWEQVRAELKARFIDRTRA